MELALRYAPVFYFHEYEKSFPIEINDKNLKDSFLMEKDKKIIDGPTIQEMLSFKNENVSLYWKEQSLYDRKDIKIYYVITYLEENYVLIQYVLIYKYNDAIGPCKLGAHMGDVEHMSVYVKNEKIEKVYFSAHSGPQGQWKSRNEIRFIDKNKEKFAVYVAKGSHAHYPNSGTQIRIFCIANDQCSNKIPWYPSKNNLIEITENKPSWIKYQGFLGFPDNCRVPTKHGWFRNEDGKEVSQCKRFCGCFEKYWWC